MRFGYWLVQKTVFCFLKAFWGLKIIGRKNVPKEGRVIVACNHIAALDPPVLGVSILRESHFAAKEPLFKNWFLGPAISYLNAFPVKRGGFDNAALKNSLNALLNDELLIMFPEGTRSRTGDFLPFRRGVGYVVAKTQAPVTPVYITGSNKLKERLFKRGGITVRFGKPIYGLAEKFPGKEGFDDIAQEIKKEIVKLKAQQSD